MTHGLEGRVPMLDNDLVDFSMRLPVDLKLANLGSVRVDENMPGGKDAKCESEAMDGKVLLRSLLSGYTGGDPARLRKQGFSGPDASWFRGESIDFVRRTLTPQAALFDVLEASTFLPLVDQHLRGEANHRLLIWSLLSLQTWVETVA
jgi:asparagine synthase (glutamine-hydrolysing)